MSSIRNSFFIMIFALSLGFAQTQLTVYNHDQALVKETFSRQLPEGLSDIEIENVAETLNPSSVKLGSEEEIQVLEQNYRYDLVNQNKLLKKYLGAEVTVVLQNDKKTSGKLLSYDNGTLVLETRSGTDIIQRNYVGSIKCPTPNERLYIRPTLSWSVNTEKAAHYDLELSYLTRGISWKAEYVAVINDDSGELDLSSWINLSNQSGKDFSNSKLKLVAGDLNRARSGGRSRDSKNAITMMAERAPVVEERSFFEYHLYEIGFPVSVHNREEKQIQWLTPTTIKARKRYLFEGGGNRLTNLPVKIQFRNDSESGTGVPLPAGIVRLFMKDTDGALELIGEDRLKHISKNDWVSLYVGNAYDVKGKKEVVDRRSRQDRYQEEDIRLTIINRKDEAVEIDIVQYVGHRNWDIRNESTPYSKLDASRIKFVVTIPGDSEKVVTYTSHVNLK